MAQPSKHTRLNALTRRHRLAIEALLQSPTVQDAARLSGIPSRSLYRWLQDPTFRDAYAAAGREALSLTVAKLKSATGAALQTLQECLADPSGAVRVSAARCILDTAVRVDVDDLARRVEALERQRDPGTPCAGL